MNQVNRKTLEAIQKENKLAPDKYYRIDEEEENIRDDLTITEKENENNEEKSEKEKEENNEEESEEEKDENSKE